jgi:cobalt-zinc-cadmium efflux system membrane fusion protein
MKTQIIQMQVVYKKLITISIIIMALFAVGCNGKSSTEVQEKDSTLTAKEDGAKNSEEDGALELTPEQIEAIGVELGTVELKNLSDVIKASGILTVPPQSRADVNVLMSGVIRRIYPIEGQSVKKGQILATIENTELAEIQQEYVTAKNAFSFNVAELKRQKELDEANAGIKRKLQEAEANYNSELARMRAMENRMKQLGINPATVASGRIINQMNVYAPISGTVGHINVNTGAYAEGGKSLMEIVNTTKVHCDLTIFEKDIFTVKVGQKVSFVLNSQNNREVTGHIYGINKSFEGETKGVIAHVVIENANAYGLVPGMVVNSLISTGSTQVVAVPLDAVVRSEGKSYIFVVDEEGAEEHNNEEDTEKKKDEKSDEKHEYKKTGEKDEKTESKEAAEKSIHFKMVEVITGVSELGYIQITSVGEIPDKPKVVVKGANYLLAKTKGGGEEEEH